MILWSPLYIVEEILLIFMGLLSFSRVVVNSVAVGGWQGGGERVVKGWFGYSHCTATFDLNIQYKQKQDTTNLR